MLQIFRDIESGGQPLFVTDHGKPVLKIEPVIDKKSIFDVFSGFQQAFDIPEEALTPEPEEWGEYQ